MRGQMNFRLKIAAAAILAVSVVLPMDSAAMLTAKQSTRRQDVAVQEGQAPPPPTVEEQIQALRQELQGQIDSLKTNLARRTRS